MESENSYSVNNKVKDHVSNDLPTPNHKTPVLGSKTRATLAQVLAVFGFGVLLIGIGLILSMPTIVIGGLLNNKNDLFVLDEYDASWFGSIIFISQPLGSVVSGFLQDSFGRKRSMMLVNVPQFIGWVIIYYSTSVFYLYFAAALLGLGLGFMEAPALSYIGETTEPRLRGMMSLLAGTFAGVGILIECFIGALTDWRTTCAISAIVPILAFLAITMIPESPTWLVVQGRLPEAEQALCWLRGWAHPMYVREEFLALLEYIKSPGVKEMTTIPSSVETKDVVENEPERRPAKNASTLETFALLLQPKIYRPLRMVLIYFFISHNASILGVRPFLVPIFRLIGMPLDPNWVVVISGGLQIVGAMFGMLFMRLLGKRKVNFISLLACVACCYLLTISLMRVDVIPWIPFGLFCLLFFAAGFGVGPLPWILVSEVFPLDGRGIAGGVAAAVSYFLGFIVTKTYINFSTWFGIHGALFIYGTVGLLGLVYLYYFLPETEGKTLEQIEEFFKDKKKKATDKRGKQPNNET